MRTTVRVTARVAMWATVLCLMVAFAAEPTTSTQLDVQEGRGVAVVQPAGSSVSRGHVSPEREPSPAWPQDALFAALTVVLVVVALQKVRVNDVLLGSGGSAGPTNGLTRRGPPAAA